MWRGTGFSAVAVTELLCSQVCYIQLFMFLSGLFWLSSNMMQLDGRYFRSICSESERKGGGYCDPDPYEYKPARQNANLNQIYRCKQHLQIGIPLIDANMFAFLLFLLIVKLEHLFISPLPPWSLWLAGRQFQIELFLESMMETTVLHNLAS